MSRSQINPDGTPRFQPRFPTTDASIDPPTAPGRKSVPSRARLADQRGERRCVATKRNGERCGSWAMVGLTVCRLHGGKTPAAREKRARAVAAVEAARKGLINRVEKTPADLLLEQVQYAAGEVAYWRARVAELDDAKLTFGISQRVEADTTGVKITSEAGAHVEYRLLTEASDRLVKYAAQALRAGVDQRRVELAERQGQVVASAIQAILAALDLTAAQQVVASEVVPRQLRAIGETADPGRAS